MASEKRKWRLMLRTPWGRRDDYGDEEEGHRFWMCEQTGRVAVVDHSGDGSWGIGNPDQAEHGVLWLDLERPIRLGVESFGPRHRMEYALIPVYEEVVKDDGVHIEKNSTTDRNVDAIKVALKFGMQLEFGDYEITARRKGVDHGMEAAAPGR